MRISDWSSDVCSSDLFDLASHRKSVLAGRGPGRVGEGLRGKAVFTIRSACRAIHWDYHHFSENVQSEARRPDALLPPCLCPDGLCGHRSDEHTSALQSLMRISYAVCSWNTKTNRHTQTSQAHTPQL